MLFIIKMSMTLIITVVANTLDYAHIQEVGGKRMYKFDEKIDNL